MLLLLLTHLLRDRNPLLLCELREVRELLMRVLRRYWAIQVQRISCRTAVLASKERSGRVRRALRWRLRQRLRRYLQIRPPSPFYELVCR